MRRLAISIALSGLVISACGYSSGGTPEGFCNRWDTFLKKARDGGYNSQSAYVEAVSAENLGDPGGDLSVLRSRIERAFRTESSDLGQITMQISDRCIDVLSR